MVAKLFSPATLLAEIVPVSQSEGQTAAASPKEPAMTWTASLVSVTALLGACATPAVVPADSLSDQALLDYAAKPFDKATMAFQHVTVGTHHGARVVADFPCSDLCPAYTTRIIHYEVAPGVTCKAVDGTDQLMTVPRGIAVTEELFCVPTVLAKPR